MVNVLNKEKKYIFCTGILWLVIQAICCIIFSVKLNALIKKLYFFCWIGFKSDRQGVVRSFGDTPIQDKTPGASSRHFRWLYHTYHKYLPKIDFFYFESPKLGNCLTVYMGQAKVSRYITGYHMKCATEDNNKLDIARRNKWGIAWYNHEGGKL